MIVTQKDNRHLSTSFFVESFGIHVFLYNFAPHFGVEYSLNCEEYLSHALYNAPVPVENKNSLPYKPRYFQHDSMQKSLRRNTNRSLIFN